MSPSEVESDDTTQPAPLAAERAVWDRLRDCLDRLNANRQRSSDPAALAQKLANRAKLLGRRTSAPAEQPTTAYLTFNSGHERFGVPLDAVDEILALDHYSPVPKTPPFVVGVIPWRGAILTLVDLGRLFGIPDSGIADYHVGIVVEAAGRRIAIAAREVEEIQGIAADQVKPTPKSPGQARAEWVAGVHDGNRLLLCLDRILQDLTT